MIGDFSLKHFLCIVYSDISVVFYFSSVFDFDDETIPVELRNGFTFARTDEQDLSSCLERAFSYYSRKPMVWKQLVQKDMQIDFSWDSPASQYENLYQSAVAQARGAAQT